MKYFQNKKLFPLGIFVFLYLLVLVPLIVFNVQQRQETRSKAQIVTPTATPGAQIAAVCGNATSDIVLVLDRSTSMTGQKITDAKNAAKLFVDIIAQQNNSSRIALVTYANNSTLNVPLTNNYASVKSAIDGVNLASGTCIQCGIQQAINAQQSQSTSKKAVVLLTDGRANSVNGSSATTTVAEQAALDAVKNGPAYPYFTIGLGADVNATLLQNIAAVYGAKYYFPPTPDHLNAIYTDISQIIGKGSVTGFVFDDANSNGQFDTNEPKLQGWTIQITQQGDTTPTTVTSDNLGTYHIPGLCDGTHQVKQVVQSGWRQTLPTDQNGYSITINKANAVVQKNFGNTKATRCSDKIDNDNNGFTDDKDATCHTDGNPNNPNSYDPNKNGENGSNTCSDSKDNNGNGLIDGADPVCHTGGNPNNPWDPNLPEITQKPDLVVTGMQITYDGSPGSFQCSKGMGVRVTFKNQGDKATSGSFVVKAGNLTSTVSNVLAPGANAAVFMVGSVAQPASATVDANNQIDESNESNNTLTQTLPVPTLPIECVPTATPTMTLTPTPANTTFQLTVFHHGIGNSGDNSNPASDFSNKNPLHKTVPAELQLYDSTNKLVGTGTGQVTYNSQTGNYTGSVGIFPASSVGFTTGKYTLKVRTDRHLRRLMTGIQTINANQHNTNLPAVTLVAGDINNSNSLNILDYNLLLDCYSDLAAASNCSASGKKEASDINDDGPVNQVDYNLFLREIATQPGE